MKQFKGEHWSKTIIYDGKEGQKTSNLGYFVFEISISKAFKRTNNVPTCTPCSYLKLHSGHSSSYLRTHIFILTDTHPHTCRHTSGIFRPVCLHV